MSESDTKPLINARVSLHIACMGVHQTKEKSTTGSVSLTITIKSATSAIEDIALAGPSMDPYEPLFDVGDQKKNLTQLGKAWSHFSHRHLRRSRIRGAHVRTDSTFLGFEMRRTWSRQGKRIT